MVGKFSRQQKGWFILGAVCVLCYFFFGFDMGTGFLLGALAAMVVDK